MAMQFRASVVRWRPQPRAVSTIALKASPTIQRLIRGHQLESMAMDATGPKGTVIKEDVEAALAIKQEADAAALAPITIDLAPMTTHLFDESLMPKQAVTNKKELVGYFTQMYAAEQLSREQWRAVETVRSSREQLRAVESS